MQTGLKQLSHSFLFQRKEERDTSLPVTHDSIRLVDQVKTIAEQRIYLDEANELYTLLTEKWIQVIIIIEDFIL